MRYTSSNDKQAKQQDAEKERFQLASRRLHRHKLKRKRLCDSDWLTLARALAPGPARLSLATAKKNARRFRVVNDLHEGEKFDRKKPTKLLRARGILWHTYRI